MIAPVFLIVLLFANTRSLPQGAPTKVCDSMLPLHSGGTIAPQTEASPYGLRLRRQNGGVFVSLSSPLGVPFQGFMLQARTRDRELVGRFQPLATQETHTINCAQLGDSLTHNNTSHKQAIDAQWIPPEDYEGPVIFNATIAQTYVNFWVGVESPEVYVSKRDVDDPTPVFQPGRPQPPSTTPPNFSPEVAKESAVEFDPFYEGCSVTKLCFGAPPGCVRSKSCRAVTAITVAGDKYDFEMKALGGPEWVGVGLSDDTKMGQDSVVECVKTGLNIDSFMSWTIVQDGIYAAERLRNSKLGIRLLNASMIDDTLYCKVRREARTNVKGKLFDLVADKYHVLIAAGSSLKPDSVGFHNLAFLASGEKQALSDVSELAAVSKLLLRLHGSFMLAAWIGTASIGILLARYYRTTWVGSTLCGKDLWFAWHRIFMVLTWALTVTGFVLIFVELKAWSNENSPHAILGTITTIICFLQPIGAYFRPHPGTPRRPVFNWLHWLGGNVAHILAIVTIFFGVKLTKAEIPEFVDWILVAYVAFHVICHLLLSVMGCISEKSSERRITSFPMKDLGGSGRSSAYADRSADSPYSGFRKVLLGIYVVIVLALMIALIVIAALAPIEETWKTLRGSMSSK